PRLTSTPGSERTISPRTSRRITSTSSPPTTGLPRSPSRRTAIPTRRSGSPLPTAALPRARSTRVRAAGPGASLGRAALDPVEDRQPVGVGNRNAAIERRHSVRTDLVLNDPGLGLDVAVRREGPLPGVRRPRVARDAALLENRRHVCVVERRPGADGGRGRRARRHDGVRDAGTAGAPRAAAAGDEQEARGACGEHDERRNEDAHTADEAYSPTGPAPAMVAVAGLVAVVPICMHP